ncbi:MAG: cupredoxin domain-containing protein [Haloarculaceae archaeon]
MDTAEVEAGDLAEGDLVLIDGDPCVVRSVETSESGGKHGTAKVTIDAEAFADGSAKSLTQPEDGAIDVPDLSTESNPLVLVGGEDGHFDPLGVGVETGGNVVWLWDDDDPHELASEDGEFESDLDSGEGVTFEHAFEDPGTYVYTCEEHEGLGVVVVHEEQ